MSDAARAGSPARVPGASLALGSALLLGLMPIFGKQALLAGVPPLAVVAIRTAGAAALLAAGMLVFSPRHFYIFPLGLVGCLAAGALNGVGSVLYYSGLARLDAGLAQMLFGFYPVFVAGVLYLDGQRHSPITLLRLALSLPAIVLMTWASGLTVDVRAVACMLAAGILYAIHIPVNQRVLYEAPAPTVTFYTLAAMTAVVVPIQWIFGGRSALIPGNALGPLLALTGVTFLSRLSLFAGLKRIGGMRTALLGLAELLVAVALAQWWLGESLTPRQWIGGAVLVTALLLGVLDRTRPASTGARGWLYWLRPALAVDRARETRPVGPAALADPRTASPAASRRPTRTPFPEPSQSNPPTHPPPGACGGAG